MAIVGPTTNHKEIRIWAESKSALPVEVLPQIVDSVPAVLRLMFPVQIEHCSEARPISWEEFFAKFDALGLTFVYDDGATGYNEILQIEEQSPYRHSVYRPANLQN